MDTLSPEIMSLIRYHLADCEFCQAELPLLAHYQPPAKGECKAPEIPINLRILAESLLAGTLASVANRPRVNEVWAGS